MTYLFTAEKNDQRSCIRFGQNVGEIYKDNLKNYKKFMRKSCSSYTQFYKWFKHVKMG